ncbi:MAG TPA: hypothetical protein VF168_00455 [Trueperaceae bacterium]
MSTYADDLGIETEQEKLLASVRARMILAASGLTAPHDIETELLYRATQSRCRVLT